MGPLTRKFGLFFFTLLVMQETSYGDFSLYSTSHSLTTDFPSDSNRRETNNGQWSVVDNRSGRHSSKGKDFESGSQTTDDKTLIQRVTEVLPRDDENDSRRKDSTTKHSTGSKSTVTDIESTSQSVTAEIAYNVHDTTLKDQTKEITESPVIDSIPDKKETGITENTNLPDPIDNYANKIYLFSPDIYGIRDQIIDMIHNSLSYDGDFLPAQTLNVLPVSTIYQSNTEGNKLTSVTYVVSHNGQFVHSETVTTVLNKPVVKKHLHAHLATKGLREYKLKPVQHKTSWIHDNLVAVVVPSCVCFVLILFITIIVVKTRSMNSKPGKKNMQKFTSPGREKCGPPPSYDSHFGINNPVYDCEASGNALP